MVGEPTSWSTIPLNVSNVLDLYNIAKKHALRCQTIYRKNGAKLSVINYAKYLTNTNSNDYTSVSTCQHTMQSFTTCRILNGLVGRNFGKNPAEQRLNATSPPSTGVHTHDKVYHTRRNPALYQEGSGTNIHVTADDKQTKQTRVHPYRHVITTAFRQVGR